MSIINSILDEEKLRLESLLNKRMERFRRLPKGSIRKKEIGKRCYLYRVFRQDGRVVTKYLCPLDSPDAASLLEAENQRKKLKQEIKTISQDLLEIRRSLGRIGRK